MIGQQDSDGFYLPLAESDIPFSTNWSGITDLNLRKLGLGGLHGNLKEVVRSLLACLRVAHHVNRGVSTSRNRNHYGGHWRRYEAPWYTYNWVIDGVDILERNELIIHEKQQQRGLTWQSRIRPSASLEEAFQHWHPISYQCRELIQLKNDLKIRVKYEDTDETQRMRRQKEAINEAVSSVAISAPAELFAASTPAVAIDGKVIFPSRVGQYRVFNHSFNMGGRIYGGFWQGLSEQNRARLLLNNCAVVEYDHPQLHPTLLYALYGKKLERDAYTVPGIERDIGKKGWNVLVNSSSVNGAIFALHKDVRSSSDELSQTFTRRMAQQVIQKLTELHQPVSGAFFSRVACQLQFIDAEMMLRVLERCMERGIIGLSVHDSAIAQVDKAEIVEGIMKDELQQVIKGLRAGLPPSVSIPERCKIWI